ncbi:MAG: hypothetical protein ACK4OO_02265 [bacterium]
MKGYLNIIRLLIPAAVLMFLQFYRAFLSPNSTIPLGLQLGVAFLCGFLSSKGSWKWAVLIGLGVPLGDWLGHFVDPSLPSPIHSLGAPIAMARSFFPTFGIVYLGVFLHRRIWGTFTEEEPTGPTFKEHEASLERFFSQYQATKESKGEGEAKQVAQAYLLLHSESPSQTEKVSSIQGAHPQKIPSPLKSLPPSLPSDIPNENPSSRPQKNFSSGAKNRQSIEGDEQRNDEQFPPLADDPHQKLQELEKRLGLGTKRATD